MYAIISLRDVVRVPPKEFGKKLGEAIKKILQEEYEGLVDESIGLMIAIIDVLKVGEGKVVPGDGAAYYDTEYSALVYKPEVHEIVEGTVTEITEFGAFLRTGPIEGLIHVSQVMNDFINYDSKNSSFTGKESGKKLNLEDDMLARIVTVSLKGNIPNSKIGLTMRQTGLGKAEWLEIDLKKKAKGDKTKEKDKGKKEGIVEKKTKKGAGRR